MEIPLRGVPFGSVKLTDGYCVNALEKETDYLLSLREERLLAGFFENAGIFYPFARYGGWENSLIGGHTLGHYLTAISQAYANAGVSREKKDIFYRKVERIVTALEECQNRSRVGEGFVWGAVCLNPDNAAFQFDCVEQGKTNILREAWVPWYTMHKLIAGLIDAYELTGLEKAKEVVSRLGDWVYRRVATWDGDLKKKVLSVEYGGMNDCLYRLYSVTGKGEHLFAAQMFDEEALFEKILSERENILDGKHANTTIPKIIGELSRYWVLSREGGADGAAERCLRVAESFWKTVVERHTYATGGNSEWEHFGKDYILDAERTVYNCETCNVYNMLKLSRMLFCATGDKKYTDYYDRAFTNAILASQNPESGMTTYFQPMAGGYFKTFSAPYSDFWCCTGSGMENFTKLGDSAYYMRGDSVFVEQYLSSVFETDRIKLVAECGFPFRKSAVFRLERAQSGIELNFRVPDWCAGKISVSKNGSVCDYKEGAGHISVRARAGEEIEIEIPVAVHLSKLPDGDAYAFCYGGAVLCAELNGDDKQTLVTGVDVTVPACKMMDSESIYFSDVSDVVAHPEKYLIEKGETFTLTGGDRSYTFGLYYKNYRKRYAIYFRLREGERGEERINRLPFDVVQAGYGQYESDELHQMKEEKSFGVTSSGTYRYAGAGGFFSYDMAVDPGKRNILSIEISSRDEGKPLTVIVGREIVFSKRLIGNLGKDFYREEIYLNGELLARNCRKKRANGHDYTVIPVRFEGTKDCESAGIYNLIEIFCD